MRSLRCKDNGRDGGMVGVAAPANAYERTIGTMSQTTLRFGDPLLSIRSAGAVRF